MNQATETTADEALTLKALTALAHAQHSGLIDSEQRGRNLIYRANFARMNGVLAYLTEHCCQGASCEVSTTAGACTTC